MFTAIYASQVQATKNETVRSVRYIFIMPALHYLYVQYSTYGGAC
jgi:hypothetical protein